MAKQLVTALGVVFVLVGLWIAVFPEQLVSMADWETRGGLYVTAGINVVTGLLMVLAAPATRYPTGIRILGGLVLLAGLGLPFIPIDFWAGLIQWWLVENLALYRVAEGSAGILLGAFLIHASLPRRPAV